MKRQKETARKELRQVKKEIQTEKLKGAVNTAATNIAESVGSLFRNNRVKTLDRANTTMHRETQPRENHRSPANPNTNHTGRSQPRDTGNATEAQQGDSRQGGNIVSENSNRKGSGMVSPPA